MLLWNGTEYVRIPAVMGARKAECVKPAPLPKVNRLTRWADYLIALHAFLSDPETRFTENAGRDMIELRRYPVSMHVGA